MTEGEQLAQAALVAAIVTLRAAASGPQDPTHLRATADYLEEVCDYISCKAGVKQLPPDPSKPQT